MIFRCLELKHVKVSLGERVVLRDVSLTIENGMKAAIVGPSGEGKSTLLRVVMGLIKVNSGEVLINGIDVFHILDDWREIAFMLSQRSHLFRRSIRDNMLLANENASEEDIWRALEMVGMHERVVEWGGLDKVVYEDFYPSGGEKARLLLARGIIRDPQVVILDEPLEGVDKLVEKEVVEDIKRFVKNRTLIVVSHRLSILSMADYFISLIDGKVTKEGPLHEHNKDSILGKYIDIEREMTRRFWTK